MYDNVPHRKEKNTFWVWEILGLPSNGTLLHEDILAILGIQFACTEHDPARRRKRDNRLKSLFSLRTRSAAPLLKFLRKSVTSAELLLIWGGKELETEEEPACVSGVELDFQVPA